jgi:hypothetical protein
VDILLIASLISVMLGESVNAAIMALLVMLSILVNSLQDVRSHGPAEGDARFVGEEQDPALVAFLAQVYCRRSAGALRTDDDRGALIRSRHLKRAECWRRWRAQSDYREG